MRWLDRLLAFCAAVVVIVSILPLGARLSWMLDLTTHFHPVSLPGETEDRQQDDLFELTQEIALRHFYKIE